MYKERLSTVSQLAFEQAAQRNRVLIGSVIMVAGADPGF